MNDIFELQFILACLIETFYFWHWFIIDKQFTKMTTYQTQNRKNVMVICRFKTLLYRQAGRANDDTNISSHPSSMWWLRAVFLNWWGSPSFGGMKHLHGRLKQMIFLSIILKIIRGGGRNLYISDMCILEKMRKTLLQVVFVWKRIVKKIRNTKDLMTLTL